MILFLQLPLRSPTWSLASDSPPEPINLLKLPRNVGEVTRVKCCDELVPDDESISVFTVSTDQGWLLVYQLRWSVVAGNNINKLTLVQRYGPNGLEASTPQSGFFGGGGSGKKKRPFVIKDFELVEGGAGILGASSKVSSWKFFCCGYLEDMDDRGTSDRGALCVFTVGAALPPQLVVAESLGFHVLAKKITNKETLLYCGGASSLTCWRSSGELVAKLETSAPVKDLLVLARFLVLNGSFWFDSQAWWTSVGGGSSHSLSDRLVRSVRGSGGDFFHCQKENLMRFDCATRESVVTIEGGVTEVFDASGQRVLITRELGDDDGADPTQSARLGGSVSRAGSTTTGTTRGAMIPRKTALMCYSTRAAAGPGGRTLDKLYQSAAGTVTDACLVPTGIVLSRGAEVSYRPTPAGGSSPSAGQGGGGGTTPFGAGVVSTDPVAILPADITVAHQPLQLISSPLRNGYGLLYWSSEGVLYLSENLVVPTLLGASSGGVSSGVPSKFVYLPHVGRPAWRLRSGLSSSSAPHHQGLVMCGAPKWHPVQKLKRQQVLASHVLAVATPFEIYCFLATEEYLSPWSSSSGQQDQHARGEQYAPREYSGCRLELVHSFSIGAASRCLSIHWLGAANIFDSRPVATSHIVLEHVSSSVRAGLRLLAATPTDLREFGGSYSSVRVVLEKNSQYHLTTPKRPPMTTSSLHDEYLLLQNSSKSVP